MPYAIPPNRLKALQRAQSIIFQTGWNPSHLRTGAKYLKSRFRGPSLVKYYPPAMPRVGTMNAWAEGLLKAEARKQGRVEDAEEASASASVEKGEGISEVKVPKLLERNGYTLNLVDWDEKTRLEDIEAKKARGKGAPKKSSKKGEGRRAQRKR